MNTPSQDQIHDIVEDIVETVPLRDLGAFADMDESDVTVLQQVFELYIERRIGAENREVEFPEILSALWERLRQTHRLRVVG